MTISNTTLRRRTMLIAAAALGCAGCAGVALARPPLVDLQVIDRDTGAPLPTWRSGGRTFVPGRSGARYALRVHNRTGARVLAVIAVDGVNIVSGETAQWSQIGYVLAPGQRHDLTGWRKSSSQVAAFEFAALPDSYAARTGRPDEVGVIGMAVFRERLVAPPPFASVDRRDADAAAAEGSARPSEARPQTQGSAQAAAPMLRERLGTGHGARERSLAGRTSFERASDAPEHVTTIEYDSHANLVAAGVIPTTLALPLRRPFPAQAGDGYVPDPPPLR